MKKLLLFSILAIALTFALASCSLFPSQPKEDVITVEDGYLVVNGVKTEYKVDEGTSPEVKEDVITVEDGYLVVNGVKTEYKVDKEDVIEFVDGYLVVNGVKTEYYFSQCDHVWQTSTVVPTCREGGYDIKTCSLCDKSVKLNYTAKLDHSYSDSYLSDISYHWHACTACGDVKDKAEHQPTDDGMCAVCEQPVSATPGVIYDVSADGTYAVVVAYSGSSAKVRIADTYEGLPVTTIYDNAFKNVYTITSVIIPDSVTTIGDHAFYWCSNLTSVVIGNSVTTIGDSAFSECSKLTSIVIPDSVTTIGGSAFSYCSDLTSVVIPDSVTTIGGLAFSYCFSLTSVVIPDSITNFGSNVFYNAQVQFNEYENCKYLGSGDNPYCYLVEVTEENFSRYKIHEDTKVIAQYTFKSCSRLTSIVIPDSVTAISDYAFQSCLGLTSVVIGDSVTTIGDHAFIYCSNLTSVVIGNSVTTIGYQAFYNCTNLTSVVIGNSVTTISRSAFYNCSSLTSVVIPDSVTTIGDYAFNCPNLKDVYYTGSEEEWKAIAIASNNQKLIYATIHYNYVPEN